jgi:hypothetical protein
MPADGHSAARARRGFVVGELLVAILLLAVAVSSLAALMYSVSHRSEMTEQVGQVACVGKTSGVRGKCGERPVGAGPKVLRSTCLAKNGEVVRGCADSGATDASGGTVVKTRTDSASLALIPKKEKPVQRARPNRGFIR